MAICWIEEVVNDHPTGLLRFRCNDRYRHPRSRDTGQEIGPDDIVVVQPGQTLRFENFTVPWPMAKDQALYVSSVIGDKSRTVRFDVHQGDGERAGWDWVHVCDADAKVLGLIDAGSLGDVPGTNHSVWHLRLEADGTINLYQVWKQGLTQREAKVVGLFTVGAAAIVVGGVLLPWGGSDLIWSGVECMIEGGNQASALASKSVPAARTSSILGVGMDHHIYRKWLPGSPAAIARQAASIHAHSSPWDRVPGSGDVMAVATLTNGVIVGVGMDHQLYWRANLSNPWEHLPDSGEVTAVAAMPDNSIVGVGMNHQLYRRAKLSSPWVHVPGSGDVMDVAVLPSGMIVGVGMDHQLYLRAALSSPWEHVPASGEVSAVAALPSGGIIGVGMDHQLYLRANLSSPWEHLPESGDVTAVSILYS